MTANRFIAVKTAFVIFLIIVLLFATGSLLAQMTAKSGEDLNVGDVLPDMAFFAAGDLTVGAKSTDDMFAAGGDVALRGAEADHMIVAGGDVTIDVVSFHDLIAAGGDVDVNRATITDDVVIAAGDVSIGPDAVIGGSVMATGGDVDIEAPIGGELRAAGARVYLASTVEGDAHLVGDKIILSPTVRIGGDLRYRTDNIEIPPSVEIVGETIKLEPVAEPDVEKWGYKAAAAAAVFALAFAVGVCILVLVVVLALPSLMNSADEMIRKRPFSTLGVGFLIVVAAPVAIAVLFATVVGAPLALLIGAILLAAAPVSIAAFIYFAGMSGRRLSARDANALAEPGATARLIWSALAAFALFAVGLIPAIGGLVWVVAYTIGIGAVMVRGGRALAFRA